MEVCTTILLFLPLLSLILTIHQCRGLYQHQKKCIKPRPHQIDTETTTINHYRLILTPLFNRQAVVTLIQFLILSHVNHIQLKYKLNHRKKRIYRPLISQILWLLQTKWIQKWWNSWIWRNRLLIIVWLLHSAESVSKIRFQWNEFYWSEL
jgi:hypothetical protein